MSAKKEEEKIKQRGAKERKKFERLLKKLNLPISDRVNEALDLWRDGDEQVVNANATLEKAKKKAEEGK